MSWYKQVIGYDAVCISKLYSVLVQILIIDYTEC